MPLDFPTSPNVGDTYQRWVWNGTSWVTAPGTPSFPSDGGTISGDLTVDGDTSVQDLDVGGDANVSGDLAVDGDLTVQGEATFVDGVTIDGKDAATEDYVDNLIDAVKNLGHFAGSFNTFALLPTNTSAFLQGLTVNDFVTVRADETQNGATTRYVATTIAANGDIIWTYDVTYSTDVSGKMDKVPTATAGNVAVFDATGQVEDGGSIDASSLQFRPMTADLHNWIPNGTAGMFVGEGNPTNSPPGFKGMGGFPPGQITKWRFTCTSDGDAMHMVAHSIGTEPRAARMFTKMKKAGDTWDFTWTEMASGYNLKIAGRSARLVQPSLSADFNPPGWPAASNWQGGYRASHRGMIHRGGRGDAITGDPTNGSSYPHFAESIAFLPMKLRDGMLTEENRFTIPTNMGYGMYIYLQRRTGRGRFNRYRYVRYSPAGWANATYRLWFNVMLQYATAQPNVTDICRVTVIADFRAVTDATSRWSNWKGSIQTPTDAENAFGFISRGIWAPTFIRVNYVWPQNVTAAERQTPAGKVVKIEFEYIPYSDLVLATISFYVRTPPLATGAPPC